MDLYNAGYSKVCGTLRKLHVDDRKYRFICLMISNITNNVSMITYAHTHAHASV